MSNSSNQSRALQGFQDSQNPSRYIHNVSSRSGVIDVDTGEIELLDDGQKVKDARRERFQLLDASAKILHGFHSENIGVDKNGYAIKHRTCKCLRVNITPTTQVLKSEQKKKAFFGGLMQCASVWTCPICAAKINERKASEMRLAFNQAPALDLKAHLITFTAPHTAGDKIADLNEKIREALSAFWRERQVAKWKKNREVVGNIRSLEVRYGSNGWHPHFHLIVFSKQSVMDDTELLLEKWKRVCVRVGLSEPNQYGLDIQDGSKAGEYICKFGSDGEILERENGDKVSWDAADEMTKGNTKKGKNGSLSPWDILRGFIESDSEAERNKFSGLFLHYARAFKGVSQLRWSRGLRKYFELEAEKSDEEIIAEQEDSAKLLCHLNRKEWVYLIRNKARATILELAESGGSEAVARYLFESIYREEYATNGGDWFAVFYGKFMARQSESPEFENAVNFDKNSVKPDVTRL